MSSTRMPADAGDLTAQARIRDAAVGLFGSDGFAHVTIRRIAQVAGVSPGLVIHHFGSKDGLRAACDRHVQQVFGDAIAELGQRGPGGAMTQLARVDVYVPVVRYGARALADGGPLAQQLFDQLVGSTESWLAASVAAGEVRPTADEHSRAKLLVSVSLGMQLLEPYLVPDVPAQDRPAEMIRRMAASAVELYTHGLFTGTGYLDALRQQAPASLSVVRGDAEPEHGGGTDQSTGADGPRGGDQPRGADQSTGAGEPRGAAQPRGERSHRGTRRTVRKGPQR